MVNLVKQDPLRSLFAWPRWIDEFDFSNQSQRGLKVYENDKDIIVEAVIAGVPSDQVEVHIEDGVVTIKAEKSQEEKKKDEVRSSSFSYYYTIALSGGQWDKTEAEVEDGVLTLTIPKMASARPQKVKVKAKSKKK